MNKGIKVVCIFLGILIVLGMIFFIIDNNRVSKQLKPIFCIKNPAGVIMDGGTIEYFGLGYKVIDFHTLGGYDDIKIGTWAMKYENFKDEMSRYEIKFEESNIKKYSKTIDGITIKLDIPNSWSYEEIVETKNDNAKFELKMYKSSTEKSASLYFYNNVFGVCGTGLTSTKLILDNGMEANVGYYNEDEKWNFISFCEINRNIAFINNGLDNNEAKELLGFVKTINISNESDVTDTSVEYSFYGKIIEANSNSILIEPYGEGRQEGLTDRVSIDLGKDNDMIFTLGTNVKITYDGIIMETYPTKVIPIKIELKSQEKFQLVFYQKTMIQPKQKEIIISKGELEKYNYNVYAYEGHIGIQFGDEEGFISLREALLQNKITMEEILEKANKEILNPISYDDGGSAEYHYDNYTIIKCHTLDGNRDVYFGTKEMKLNDVI